MQFSYYGRLTAREKSVYRASDRAGLIDLPRPTQCRPLVERLQAALEAGNRAEVQRTAGALCRQVARNLGVPPVDVEVLERRPVNDGGDLHGLYTSRVRRRPRIKLWMRTARRDQVIAFRTFLRTLVHELCHHLDYWLFDLPDSFHTQGFYRRESELFQQLAG